MGEKGGGGTPFSGLTVCSNYYIFLTLIWRRHMLKKMTVLFVVAVLLASFSVSFAKQTTRPSSFTEQKIEKVSKDTYVYREGMIEHNLTVSPNATAVLDTMYYFDPTYLNSPLPYLFPGDTVTQGFKLIPDPARLVKIRGIFGPGGTADAYVWMGNNNGASYVKSNEVLANQTWNVTGEQNGQLAWDVLDFTDNGTDTLELPYSPDPDPANRPYFVIGYVASGTSAAEPVVYMDYNTVYISGVKTNTSLFSYQGATWYVVNYGNGARAQWAFQVIVNYYNGTSPFILGMSSMNDTWKTSNFPTVMAQIRDIDGTITEAKMFYQKNSETPASVTETSVEGEIYSFDIPGTYAPGDTITYWVEATDNDSKSILGGSKSFVVLAPEHPNANYLVVLDGLGVDDVSATYDTVLTAVFGDSLSQEYEMWNMDEHGGIDNSIIDHSSFNSALLLGYGVGTIPVGAYDNSEWKSFVESGKSMFLASPDYLYVNGIGADLTPVDGDFVKDVFGVGTALSDPNTGGDSPLSTGDDIIIGMAGDPITNQWAENPILFNFDAFLGGSNWGDYVAADETLPNAATIFLGGLSGEGNGVRNVNAFGGATVYVPFDLAAMADTLDTGEPYMLNDANIFVKNVVEWMDAATGIGDKPVASKLTYKLEANYPNPFNPTTTIKYTIKDRANVSLTIYNTLGEKVKTLVNDSQAPNNYTVTWNGTNDKGARVASGVYIYRLTAGDFVASQKMILMK